MKTNQVKWGVMLSYILIICNALYGFVITPYMIGSLGDAEYGVYKTIAAFAGALMVLDLGLGSTVQRYVAQYKAKNEEEKIPNFVAMSLLQALVLSGVIAAVSFAVYQTIDTTYADTFTAAQIDKAQTLFLILIVNMVLHVFNNVLSGVISGHNRFVFGNGVKIVRLFVRAIAIVVLLRVIPNAIVVILVDTFCSLLFMLAEYLFIKLELKVKIKFSKFDMAVFKESGKYTMLMFLAAIAAQMNSNLDNVVIGAISGPELVTIYSLGLIVFQMFMSLSTAVSGVMLPTVSNILAKENSERELFQVIVRAGRIQFLCLGAAFAGFACIGKDFLTIWMGSGYEDAYIITLILMGPSLLELCVNTCLAVLRAKNRIGFYTSVLFGATVLNAVVTYIAVKQWSYIGAAFGTAASFIVGNLIIMNIYFSRKIGIPILKVYGNIFRGILPCLLVSSVVLLVSSYFIHGTIVAFVINVAVFAAVYGITLWFFGLNKEEKSNIPILNRFVK